MQTSELGKMVGVITIGYITDKIQLRCLLLPFAMLIATLNFFFLSLMSSSHLLLIYVQIFVAGILIGCPKILTGPVA